MAVKVGINGFGRIGRYLLRLSAKDPDLQIAAINARVGNDALAYLFKYDSTFGRYAGEVDYDDAGLIVDGRHIAVTRCDMGKWEWGKLGVQIAVESTGKLKDREGLSQHLACGASKVIIAAPGKGVDATIVMGVNDNVYTKDMNVLSAASCTTNCMAPATKVINDNFKIVYGMMTTVHSYTMTQRILDGSDKKDWRRGRAAAVSMVPSSTGAASAVGKVIPELAGKLTGISVRVPTPDCSLVDLTCLVEKQCDVESVNAALRKASETTMKDNLGFSMEPLVSVDYVGSTYGGVVDGLSTEVVDGKMLKLFIWYDNEAGFTNQLLRLIRMVAASL